MIGRNWKFNATCFSSKTRRFLLFVCATRRALITCNTPCATRYEETAQLLGLTRVEIAFMQLAETINRWKRGGNRSTQRKHPTTSFRNSRIMKPENPSPCRDSSLRFTVGGKCLLGKHATRGVTVSTSAFLACHQCYCAGSRIAWSLNLLGFSMWHFLKLVARGFRRVFRFPPLFHRLMVSDNKIKLKYMRFQLCHI